MLRKIYKTNLNPLPVKFEDLQKTEMIKIVCVKMMNIEVLMIKFKWGNSLPSILREWYPEEHEDIFPHLKGHNGSEKLADMVRKKGFKSVGFFMRSLIERCFSHRLGGREKLEEYHMLWDFDELEKHGDEIERDEGSGGEEERRLEEGRRAEKRRDNERIEDNERYEARRNSIGEERREEGMEENRGEEEIRDQRREEEVIEKQRRRDLEKRKRTEIQTNYERSRSSSPDYSKFKGKNDFLNLLVPGTSRNDM